MWEKKTSISLGSDFMQNVHDPSLRRGGVREETKILRDRKSVKKADLYIFGSIGSDIIYSGANVKGIGFGNGCCTLSNDDENSQTIYHTIYVIKQSAVSKIFNLPRAVTSPSFFPFSAVGKLKIFADNLIHYTTYCVYHTSSN